MRLHQCFSLGQECTSHRTSTSQGGGTCRLHGCRGPGGEPGGEPGGVKLFDDVGNTIGLTTGKKEECKGREEDTVAKIRNMWIYTSTDFGLFRGAVSGIPWDAVGSGSVRAGYAGLASEKPTLCWSWHCQEGQQEGLLQVHGQQKEN